MFKYGRAYSGHLVPLIHNNTVTLMDYFKLDSGKKKKKKWKKNTKYWDNTEK